MKIIKWTGENRICTQVEIVFLVFTCMPGESYFRQLRSLLLYLCNIIWALMNSLVCWFFMTWVDCECVADLYRCPQTRWFMRPPLWSCWRTCMTNTLWSSARSTGWTLLQSILSHASLTDRCGGWGKGCITIEMAHWFLRRQRSSVKFFSLFFKKTDFFKSVNVCCYVVFERGLELFYVPDVMMC